LRAAKTATRSFLGNKNMLLPVFKIHRKMPLLSYLEKNMGHNSLAMFHNFHSNNNKYADPGDNVNNVVIYESSLSNTPIWSIFLHAENLLFAKF
jgi:hypothetical protein